MVKEKDTLCSDCGHTKDNHFFYEDNSECIFLLHDSIHDYCPCKKFVPDDLFEAVRRMRENG